MASSFLHIEDLVHNGPVGGEDMLESLDRSTTVFSCAATIVEFFFDASISLCMIFLCFGCRCLCV